MVSASRTVDSSLPGPLTSLLAATVVRPVIAGQSRVGQAADRTPCSALASAPPLPLAAARPAADVLRRLALRAGQAPGDTETGAYTRIGLTQWIGHARIGNEVGTAVCVTQRWRDELTDSGRTLSTGWQRPGAHRPRNRPMTYGAGRLPGVLRGRVSNAPFALAAALDTVTLPPAEHDITDLRYRVLAAAGRRDTDTTTRVLAIADLMRWHHTPSDVRTGIVLTLAGVPDLMTHGHLTMAGRTAIAFSVTGAITRDVLLIDPITREVWATERVLLDPGIGRRLGVAVPYSLERTVIHDQGRELHPKF